MKFKALILIVCSLLLVACASRPPRDVNNICHVFQEYPRWYRDAVDVQRRWKVPVAVQMAIVHQESKFDGHAKPPRQKLLWIIPWKRPSSAYGYSQALRSTWAVYKRDSNGGSFWAQRDVFAHAVDFIGWYANQANRRAGIPRTDAYRLYLAYHEGVGGYQRRTYLKKPWLIQVAHKVSARSQIYQAQLNQCRGSLPKSSWF
ncbi:transglycosylase SLT domain-containing protein [Legionella jordanis]|uniref:Transcriptional regulator n=1 Tax=Legionella jordanis TaxID=456 RepID=A0A0W0V8F2_9GAMM|nr:hypothetical protein [Legionella jordanis]KTD16157.1 transcriptional regulator [Legionella jordanis]RMX04617.1 hypothetical protein EAW55_04055 [Legionella jordanis]RMX18326.1 hypothetical protein EAS68_08240 [Legionella jordanis]VEH12383.1 transcriptional regulator [Legionella jordanis]HAT8713896.1 hypothetical protein [Legionella jordanis]